MSPGHPSHLLLQEATDLTIPRIKVDAFSSSLHIYRASFSISKTMLRFQLYSSAVFFSRNRVPQIKTHLEHLLIQEPHSYFERAHSFVGDLCSQSLVSFFASVPPLGLGKISNWRIYARAQGNSIVEKKNEGTHRESRRGYAKRQRARERERGFTHRREW